MPLAHRVVRRVGDLVPDVAVALESYRTDYGAYPWLSAYRDPGGMGADDSLSGWGTAGSAGNVLVDADADFTAFCRSTGHELLESGEENGVYRFLVKRTK